MRTLLRSMVSRSWRPAFPIRLRLTLWYVALLAVILLAFCAYLYFSLSHSLNNELDATLTMVATQVVSTVDSENGRPSLGQETGQLSREVVVALYDRSGQILVDGSPPWSPSSFSAARARAANGEAAYDVARLPSDNTWRVLVVPVRENGRTIGVLAVGRSHAEMEGALRGLLLLMTVAVPAILLLAAGGGVFLAQRALSPIDRITRLAQRIGAEDLSRRLDLPDSRDEVGRLAATFDEMLDRLDRAFQRQRQFAADASHELRTPLSIITSQVDVTLGRPRAAAEYKEALRVVGEEAARLRQLVSQLLTLARADAGQDAPEQEAVSLDELAHEVAAQLAPMAAARDLHLAVGRVEPAIVLGDQTRLMQLLLNLADNALKYTPAGGRVTIRVGRETNWATLSVADTGLGIAPEHLSHIFERFYRVDKARSRAEGGTGLGLTICDWIARTHGGRIAVSSTLAMALLSPPTFPSSTLPKMRKPYCPLNLGLIGRR